MRFCLFAAEESSRRKFRFGTPARRDQAEKKASPKLNYIDMEKMAETRHWKNKRIIIQLLAENRPRSAARESPEFLGFSKVAARARKTRRFAAGGQCRAAL